MGAHIFLSEDNPVPCLNKPVLTISQIIKFFMSSAAKSELGGLFITAKTLVPLRKTLMEMNWPQPRTLIQTNNSTAAGFTNNTIVPKQLKSMDMRFHWLRCHMVQGQFCFYWDRGVSNMADYSTKNHPES